MTWAFTALPSAILMLELFIDDGARLFAKAMEWRLLKLVGKQWRHAIDHVTLKVSNNSCNDEYMLKSVIIKPMCECWNLALSPSGIHGCFSLGIFTSYTSPNVHISYTVISLTCVARTAEWRLKGKAHSASITNFWHVRLLYVHMQRDVDHW